MDPAQQQMIQALLAQGQNQPGMGQQPPSSMLSTPPPGAGRLPPPVQMPAVPGGQNIGLPPPVSIDGTGMNKMSPVPMPMKEPYVLTPEEQAQWQKYLGGMER